MSEINRKRHGLNMTFLEKAVANGKNYYDTQLICLSQIANLEALKVVAIDANIAAL